MSLGFAVPMVWREQKDHTTDCYFCITKIKGYNQKIKKSIACPNLPSAICPVPHSAKLPIPKPPSDLPVISDESAECSEDSSTEFDPCVSERRPHFITQEDLNDLVRDLNLCKDKSELLVSRLQQWNLLLEQRLHSTERGLRFYQVYFLLVVSCATATIFLLYLKVLA